MIRAVIILSVLPLLAGCLNAIPDSGAELGAMPGGSQFDIDRARREAALTGSTVRTTQGIVPPSASNVIPVGPAGVPQQGTVIPQGDLQAAGIGTPTTPGMTTVLGTDPLRTPGGATTATNTGPVQIASSGISNEQDFGAVTDERNIEDDAALRARQQAAYEVIQPEALPERGNAGPNIVQYALSAPNSRGQEWYSRTILSGQSRFERNCASYRSPDDAQRDFLARGGPERDARGVDPDGDGFACGWDPAPFRAAVGN